MQIIDSTEQENKILNRLKDDYITYSEMIHSERRFLNSLILRYKPKKLLEVGVSAGASSLVMLNAIKDDPEAVLYSLDYSDNWYHNSSRKTGFLLDQYPDLKDQWCLKTGKLSFRFMEEIGDNIDFLFLDTMHCHPGELFDFLMVLPFLKKNCPVVLHDINLHSFDFNPQERSFQITNNMLFAAFTGERLILQNNIQDNMAGHSPLVNIGGVILADDARDHVWEIVNALSAHWVYMPEENDLRDMQTFFAKFYDTASLDLLNQIINYQRFVRVALPCVKRPIRKKCCKVLCQTLANLTFGSLRQRILKKVYKYTLQEKLAQQIRSILFFKNTRSKRSKYTGFKNKEMYWDDSWKIYDTPLLSYSEYKEAHGDDLWIIGDSPLSSFQKLRDPQNTIVMDICFASDNNYSHALGIAITSILATRKPNEHFRFYILDGGISETNKERLLYCAKNESLTFLKIDNEKFQGFTVPEGNQFNITVYYRFLLPERLPSDIDRVLYLDCDILVLDSLADLWRYDLKGAHLAAARDFVIIKIVKMPEQIDTTDYVNAGVLLIDLEKWRYDHIQEELFEFACTTSIPLPWNDQDIINIKLKDSIEYLPPVWNFLTYYEGMDVLDINLNLDQIKILHYAGHHKPWNPGNTIPRQFQTPYYRIWRKTPWKSNLCKFYYLDFIKKFRRTIKKLPKQILHVRWSSKVKYCIICGFTLFQFPKRTKRIREDES